MKVEAYHSEEMGRLHTLEFQAQCPSPVRPTPCCLVANSRTDSPAEETVINKSIPLDRPEPLYTLPSIPHEPNYNCIERKINPECRKVVPPKGGLTGGLQVIGVGQMRTGTTSLKHALELLYQVPCYHMSDLLYLNKQTHIQQWIDTLKQLDIHRKWRSRAFWDKLYAGCICAVDYPTCLFYEELMRAYPHAKFILTVRDPDEWVHSCQATTLRPQLTSTPSLGSRFYHCLLGITGLPELHRLMFSRALGSSYSTGTFTELREAYTRWNDSVRATIPPDRLLIFHVDQGWAPLCDFLQFPIPTTSSNLPTKMVPFPHLNKRMDMQTRLDRFYKTTEQFNSLFILCICFLLVIMLYLSWLRFG